MHYLKRHSSRNIRTLIIKKLVGADGHPRLRGSEIWQSSFHDHTIRDENDLETHLDYIKFNPIKHGVSDEGEKFPYMHINESLICED